MDSTNVSVKNLSCPVCLEIFKVPVLLSCSHSVCKECLQQFWRAKRTQQCPVCRRKSSKEDPPCNLVLNNLCESFVKKSSSGSEEICSLHSEKLKLFCREDKQPVCLVCRDSEKHLNHHFLPINEIISSYKDELNTALKSLQKVLKQRVETKGECDITVTHIKAQAEHTEKQIKEEFEKLHQFLRDEEEASIIALREEEQQKSRIMKEKLEEVNRQISALSDTIKDMEERMKDTDVSFLKNFNVLMERAQSSQQDAEILSGALVNVGGHLGNLPFRIWKKMQKIVQNTPVILDTNTAYPKLILSDDLTSMRCRENIQPLPDNPERFDYYPCVLGSEGINSGTHCWDVEVKNNANWIIGITTESNQRKGRVFFDTDVWYVRYSDAEYSSQSPDQPRTYIIVKQHLQRIRVDLDYGGGKISFSDPVTKAHLLTFKTTFTQTIFPVFYSYDNTFPLKILPTSKLSPTP